MLEPNSHSLSSQRARTTLRSSQSSHPISLGTSSPSQFSLSRSLPLFSLARGTRVEAVLPSSSPESEAAPSWLHKCQQVCLWIGNRYLAWRSRRWSIESTSSISLPRHALTSALKESTRRQI